MAAIYLRVEEFDATRCETWSRPEATTVKFGVSAFMTLSIRLAQCVELTGCINDIGRL